MVHCGLKNMTWLLQSHRNNIEGYWALLCLVSRSARSALWIAVVSVGRSDTSHGEWDHGEVEEMFNGMIISKRSNFVWFPRSPEFSPLDFFSGDIVNKICTPIRHKAYQNSRGQYRTSFTTFQVQYANESVQTSSASLLNASI